LRSLIFLVSFLTASQIRFFPGATSTTDLNFAAKLNKNDKDNKKRESDPFPEGMLRAKILDRGNGTAEWMEYLRSRIRLSRSLAVFVPGLTISGILRTSPNEVPDYTSSVILGITALIYSFTFISVLIRPKLPKTWGANIKIAIQNFSWVREPTTLAATLLAALATSTVVFLACKQPSTIFKTFPILITGSLLSILSFWTWSRINETFRKFLIMCQQIEKKL